MKPSLSIIIPVYNVEQYLEKCLDSVLVDNEFTGQVVCVNDGSKDGSLAILEKYSAKYTNIEIISQPNAGLSAARNAGLDKATGDYVFFLDSDDWIAQRSIDRVLEKIGREDVIYFNAKKYYESTQTYDAELDIPEHKHLSGLQYFSFVYGTPRTVPLVCVVGGVYRRAFLLENNLYNENGIYHEDNYFTPQVLLAAKEVSSINEYVYVYRIREGSITAYVTEKHIKDLLYVARNLYDKYNSRGDVPEVFYKDICQIYINLIEKAYCGELPLCRYWRILDSRRMLRCAYDARSRKIAKLTYLSPRLAYRYMTDALPSLLRRIINRNL